MSLTEVDSACAAGELFDEVIEPLAIAMHNTGAPPYFPAGRDPSVASYFMPSSVTSMRPADFEFPGGGSPEGLITALVTHWAAEGETVLAATGPHLVAIADALGREAIHGDGSVDIFCYTLF